MTRVMAVGVFDLIHPGHLHYLAEARSHGDELVVVVARDPTVLKRKGFVVLPEERRLRILQAIKGVDLAVLGDPEDQFRTVEHLRPDVIALGWDDHHDPESIRQECARRSIDVRVVRCTPLKDELASTTRVLRRIVDAYQRGFLDRRLGGSR